MPPEEALDGIFQAYGRSDAPGLVVGISHRGAVVYRRGFGLASLELGVANAPGTRMRIGSSTKQFTCLAALLLAEEGRLDLDASTRAYVPELDVRVDQPTLRQCMRHTGGQRCYVDLGFLVHGLATWPKDDALKTQARQSEGNFRPGENMIYCNGGYHLLSLAVERASGIPFERFLKERIFAPLGMGDTDCVPDDLQMQRGMAALHIPLPGGGYRRGMFPTEEVRGEGAIVSTVDDMLRWLAHLRGKHKIVGSASSWAQLLTVTSLNGISNPYALGVMRHGYRGVEVIHHAGGVVGGASEILTVPAYELDIAILSNTAAVDPTGLAYRVVDALLDHANLGPPKSPVPGGRFRHLTGEWYASPESGLVVRFVDMDGVLGLSVLNGPPSPLYRDGDNLRLGFEQIAAGPYDIDLTQLSDENGAPESISLSECGRPGRFERLQAAPLEPTSTGPAVAGRYRSPDLAADAVLAMKDRQLQMTICGRVADTNCSLQQLSNSVFAWEARDSLVPLRGVLSLIRAGGQVTGFGLDTVRTRHLHFARCPEAA